MFISVRDYFPHIESDVIIAYREHYKYFYSISNGVLKRSERITFPHAADCESVYDGKECYPYYAERVYFGDDLQFNRSAPRILPFGVANFENKTIMCDADKMEIIGLDGFELSGEYRIYAWSTLLLIVGAFIYVYDAESRELLRYTEVLGTIEFAYREFVFFRHEKRHFLLNLEQQRFSEISPNINTSEAVVVENYIYRLGRRFNNLEEYLLDMHKVNYSFLKFENLTLAETILPHLESFNSTSTEEAISVSEFEDQTPICPPVVVPNVVYASDEPDTKQVADLVPAPAGERNCKTFLQWLCCICFQ